MKKRINYITALLMGSIIAFSGCTDSFEKYNTDQSTFPDEIQVFDYYKYGLNAEIAQKGIYFNYNWGDGINWPFQIMQNLSADMFCGYFHDFAFHEHNSAYALNNGWNSSSWNNTYGYILPAIIKSEEMEKDHTDFSILVISKVSKIIKVATMHRIADQYGPIIYSKFGSKTGSDPESLKDAYYAFFTDLDEGINDIQKLIAAHPGHESFYRFDILTKTRTLDEWLRFANSLRLRLAMRISNVDAEKAQTEVNKSMTSGIGFLEPGIHMIAVNTTGTGYSNPLGEINKSWGEVFMNASMESFLVGYEDPRLPKYFDRAAGGGDKIEYRFDIAGTFKGFRQGMNIKHNQYAKHSRSTISQSTPAILMTPAEVCFLLAEAALRGFTDGNAKVLYEQGIAASFSQWGVDKALADYLISEKTPADFKDALKADAEKKIKETDEQFDVDAMTDITPKWNDGDSPERKLERIITQKWIACYPEGVEAWSEQRRTGYPKLFKVYKNMSGGTIDTDIMIRRLPFPEGLEKDNPDQYGKLIQLLGGANTGGTRLWWDAGQNNF